MKFFNFKRKNTNISGGIDFKQVKKLSKKDKNSVAVLFSNQKKGLNFYKIGQDIYAPIPQQNSTKPLFFKVNRITFVLLDNENKNDNEKYNISIEYKKNSGNHFYSYDLCSEQVKNSVCLNLGNIVNIELRDKDKLINQKQDSVTKINTQTQPKKISQKKPMNHCELKFPKSSKHIVFDKNHIFTQEETNEILKKAIECRRKANGIQIKRENVVNAPAKTSVNRYEIAGKREVNLNKPKISELKDFKKNMSYLTQEQIDDIYFFQ